MDFDLTENQLLIRSALKEVTKKYPPSYWRQRDDRHEFPAEFWSELSAGGWSGIPIPVQYGGLGFGMLELALAIEDIASSGAGFGGAWLLVLNSIFGAMGICRHGSKVVKEKYLPGLAKGKLLFALALTEPQAGSNTFATQTKAVKHGDEYVLNGQKVFITSVDKADYITVVARTTARDEAPNKSFGITLLIVDAKSEGVKYYPMKKLGTNTYATGQLFFEDVRVPEDEVLGEADRGWNTLVDILNPERIGNTSVALGTADAALRLALDYAKNREIFGRAIGANQGIQFPLADAYSKLEVAKVMNYKAAWLFDHGRPCAAEASVAKLRGTDAAFEAADWAMQAHGGYGYVSDYDIERYWRDLRLLKIAPVTQQMTMAFIAEHVLGLPKSY